MYQVYYYTQEGKGTEEFETESLAVARMRELLWNSPIAPYIFQVISPEGTCLQSVSDENAS